MPHITTIKKCDFDSILAKTNGETLEEHIYKCLIEYKKFLHKELEKVEEKIKHWKKVPVE